MGVDFFAPRGRVLDFPKRRRRKFMKLVKATLPKLWSLTRTTSMVVGLAVMLALVAGVASLAVARTPSGGATATAILKGVSNTAATTTTLINSGPGAALNLQVQPGNPPLTANPEAGTATNLSADKVDGKDSTAFVSATNGKAPDSELLDGKDSPEFLGASAKAADSDKLDGKDSTDFAAAGTGTAYTARTALGTVTTLNPEVGHVDLVSKNVPAGSYAINAKGWFANEDDDDQANVRCELWVGGTLVDYGPHLTLGENAGQSVAGTAQSQDYPLQAVVTDFGGGAITMDCISFSNSDRVDASNAIITAIKVGSVQ
jgi:hypothetical protein